MISASSLPPFVSSVVEELVLGVGFSTALETNGYLGSAR
jgi:hypothetical protein